VDREEYKTKEAEHILVLFTLGVDKVNSPSVSISQILYIIHINLGQITIHSCIGRFFCYNMGISYRIEQMHISSHVIHIKGSYTEILQHL